jgi:hypothetical protein
VIASSGNADGYGGGGGIFAMGPVFGPMAGGYYDPFYGGYGWGRSRYGYGGGGWWGGPVVIVRGTARPHGSVSKDGYTQSGEGTSTASPRTTKGSSGSGSSSSSGKSSGSGSSERKAKRKGG